MIRKLSRIIPDPLLLMGYYIFEKSKLPKLNKVSIGARCINLNTLQRRGKFVAVAPMIWKSIFSSWITFACLKVEAKAECAFAKKMNVIMPVFQPAKTSTGFNHSFFSSPTQ